MFEIEYPPAKPSVPRISERDVVIVSLLVLNCVVAWLVVDITWLLAIVAVVIVGLILALVQQATPPPEPLRALTIAPDHVGVAGKRVAMKDVRRIEQLTSAGNHDVVLHTDGSTVLAARATTPVHARYIADQIETAYRAFLRRGSLS